MLTNQEIKQLETKARNTPGKKVKIRAGLYFYLPTNCNELFEIEKLPNDFVDEGMWAIHGEAWDSQIGDHDLFFTLKEAMEALNN
jgi:hypothetical protein